MFRFLLISHILTILSLILPVNTIANQVLDTVEVKASSHQNFTPHDFIGSHENLSLEAYKTEFIEFDHILKEQAGINILSISGVGQYSTPTIRGAEGQQVLVFENGIPLNSVNGSGADISSVSLINTDSIHIYRGFVPMELSPTAIGGAINLIPSSQNHNIGHIKLSAGSYGVKQINLAQSFKSDPLHGQFFLENLSADNDFIYTEAQPVSSPSTPKKEPRHNNESQRKLIGFTSEYDFNEFDKITISSSYKENTREISSRINSPKNYTNISGKQTQFTTTYSSGNLSSNYSYSQTSEIYDDRESKVGLGAQHNQYDTAFHKLNLTYKMKFKSSDLIFNHQGQRETVSLYYLDNDLSNTKDCSITGICDSKFTRSQISSGIRNQWAINDQIYTNVQIVNLTNKDQSKLEQVNNTSNFTSLFTGISYLFTNGILLNSYYSQQIRPPSTNELFGDKGTTQGNPELQEEKSKAIEIGIEHSNFSHNLSTYIFHRIVGNNIVAEQDSRGIIKYSNIAKTEYQGLELSFKKQIMQDLEYNINATIQEGIIIDDHLIGIINNQVSDHRDHTISQALSYKLNTWSIKLNYIHESGGYYTNQNDLNIPEKNQIDILIKKSYGQTLLAFKAINLTDQRVRDYPKSPVSGRTFYLSLNHSWELQ